MQTMNWEKLLSSKRLRSNATISSPEIARDDFQRDFDRIVFSSAFRRLQDKTQVFPLAESDYIRKRLTHSLETSCVGRSLGSWVGDKIIKKYELKNIYPFHFGTIVATACLAHDLGNPPFGHSGEDAIRTWFSGPKGHEYMKSVDTKIKKADLLKFEGNAQGFRLLTKLLYPQNDGGMQLTCATLAAFTKYPKSSHVNNQKKVHKGVSSKKHGYFESERSLFNEVASEVGLIPRITGYWWCRHPLAFLVEAADDICYRIIDFEDGWSLKYVSFEEVSGLLLETAGNDSKVKDKLDKIRGKKEKVEYLRAIAINELIKQVTDVFLEKEEEILAGNFDDSLIKYIPSKDHLKKIIDISKAQIYSARPVIEIEAAGFDVVDGLLSNFVNAIEENKRSGDKASSKSRKYIQLLPKQFWPSDDDDLYLRLLKISDFISGMTDSYAVSIFRKITGMSLPH